MDRPDLGFYRAQSALSSPGRFAAIYDGLPNDLAGLCLAVQNALLHQFWIHDEANYGVSSAALQASGRKLNDEINLRTVEDELSLLARFDSHPLTQAREPQNRVVGNCRHYALLLTSMLRHQGVPARVRSGVAPYFYPDGETWEDHFICECWDEVRSRWRRVDPQIDDLQRRVLGFALDACDLPPGQFLDAGETFVWFAEGRIRPEKVGIFDYRGAMYVRYKLLSDLASVCGVEVLPWEVWGLCADNDADRLSPEDLTLLAHVARVLERLALDPAQFAEAQRLFHDHARLRMPQDYQPVYWKLPLFG